MLTLSPNPTVTFDNGIYYWAPRVKFLFIRMQPKCHIHQTGLWVFSKVHPSGERHRRHGLRADAYRWGPAAASQRSCRSRWQSSWAPGDPSASTPPSGWCGDWRPSRAGDPGGSGGWGSRGRGHQRTSRWSFPPAHRRTTHLVYRCFYVRLMRTFEWDVEKSWVI